MENVLELANELETLPETILAYQMDIINLTESIEKNSNEIESLEIDIKTAVLNATDEAGKKAYTNDEARKIAFISDCKENEEHQSLVEARSNLSRALQIKRAHLEMLNSRQRNLRVLIEAFAGVEVA
jgi:hypothetical protein